MKITAHSGCDGTSMNSMEFLEHAATLDIDVVEIDIRKGPDGNLVLGHDATLDASPVTLEEAFRFIDKTGLHINCDLKENGIEKNVVETARQTGFDLEKLIFSGSVELRSKEKRMEEIGETQVYMNIEEIVPGIYEKLAAKDTSSEDDLLRAVQMCAAAECEVINVDFHFLNKRFKEICGQYQLKISAWTVTEERDIEWIEDLGVYNITSRAPGLVREILNRK
ncbi:MAG: glycerophosphodiester phosphodiesterase [Clostridia bacterium]|nr:glycerophosphodiester phosphodiesterase [Clostridia bacterium]NCC42817.1 glycerophosphodiester phosphodiesterase [Clostridia bacterium]